MREEPTRLPADTPPRWTASLFMDPIGNWFARVERCENESRSISHTGTFTTPAEALEEACERMPPR